MTRRVVADWDSCEANGLCEAVAPDVFALDDEDQLHLKSDVVTDANAEQIQRAVDSCPKFALTIVETEDE